MPIRNGNNDKLSLYIMHDALGVGVWVDCPELECKTIGDTEREALGRLYRMAKTKANALVVGKRNNNLLDFQKPMLPYAKTVLGYRRTRDAFVKR